MQQTFKGRVIGNNLRKDFSDYQNIKDVPSSTVELENNPLHQLSHFEIDGFHPIGSEVSVQITIEAA